MIELKVKVEEQLIHQFGKGKIEQYLYQMLQRLRQKEDDDLSIVVENKALLFDKIELSDAAVAFVEQHDLRENIEATLVRIADYFDNYTIKIKHRIDEEEGFETLFIYIITHLSVRESFKITRAMYKNWALLKEPNFSKHIAITTRNENGI